MTPRCFKRETGEKDNEICPACKPAKTLFKGLPWPIGGIHSPVFLMQIVFC